MKLEWPLICAILSYVEAQDGEGPYDVPKELGDYTEVQIHSHIHMCYEAHLFEMCNAKIGGIEIPHRYSNIGELTYKGHQELARLRHYRVKP